LSSVRILPSVAFAAVARAGAARDGASESLPLALTRALATVALRRLAT
jgi:hypothetical protein